MQIASRQVLLLNASYEPLGLISIPRAVRLLWLGTAIIELADGDRVLRSQRMSHPSPSVIRLKEYRRVPDKKRIGSLRTRIFLRDKYRCQYCGVRTNIHKLTLDHVLPRSRGGTNNPTNLVASCRTCNIRKSDRTPSEARMPLLSDPAAVRIDVDVQAHHLALKSRPEWLPYLGLAEYESEVA